jgi:flagellum-specific peptidoglycan hydrolase FlgJ
MKYRYTIDHQEPTQPVHSVISYIEKHWFQLFILGLGIYILFFKDISVQFNMNAANATPERVIVSPEGSRSLGMARPASYQSSAGNTLNVSHLENNKATKQSRKWDSRQANDFSNLTFILSPDYGERHNVRPKIVREKIQNCKDYVKEFLPAAREERDKYGIPVSITLAQGLLESNAGDSRLARESNNHFGIKCRRKCRGCTCRNYNDDDIYDMFRVFNTVGESYREHSLLLNNSRYKHLLNLRQSDYKGWAHGLKAAGYATDKRYAQKLIQIIEFLNLDRYDR